jgi:hypothetical protein
MTLPTERRSGCRLRLAPFTAYLFDVELELHFDPRRLHCQIGFAEIPRHILGRDILFHEYLFAFAEREQRLYYRLESP